MNADIPDIPHGSVPEQGEEDVLLSTMTSPLQRALFLCQSCHKDQYDKAGVPYAEHPRYVASRIPDEEGKIVALLHDTLEDTALSPERLRALFGERILAAVQALTRRPGEDYFACIARAAKDPLARRVKIEDLKHNMDLSRLREVTERDLERVEKYRRALAMLCSGETHGKGPCGGEKDAMAGDSGEKEKTGGNMENIYSRAMEQLRLTVDGTRRACPMGDLYGVFFEDINHAADGGLYAELVQNRDFEFLPVDNKEYDSLTGYEVVGGAQVVVRTENPPFPANPHYAVVTAEQAGAGLRNGGYHQGIALRAGEQYRCVLRLRAGRLPEECAAGERPAACGPSEAHAAAEQSVGGAADKERAAPDGGCRVYAALETADGRVLAGRELFVPEEWREEAFVLCSGEDCRDAYLSVRAQEPCRLYLDYVSLFPCDTYRGRENGLRRDLAEAIEELSPRFVRFPGGCLVHDGSLRRDARDALYFWKNTIGPLSERAGRRNNWGYHQTLGLGYYEYFLFCEDIGAKPLPVLPAAYNPHRGEAAPLDELEDWIADALDLIEFANGDETTEWGKRRAELGHPKPFDLEYIAIGNEELFSPFLERYPYFQRAIKERYPELRVISSVGPFADGEEFERMWREADRVGADFADEHYYMAPEWLLKHVHRYDGYPRTGARVFLGEYASLGNKWENALCEAAYLTGLERNVDKVGLACYAPLLCNRDYVNWRPDLIWFDGTSCLRTANYYVQKLFMRHQGAYRLESALTGGTLVRQELPDISGQIGLESENEEVLVHAVRVDGRTIRGEFALHGTERFPDVLAAGRHEIEVSFTKTKGKRQVVLRFGDRGEEYYRWEIGGWSNDMSSIGRRLGGRYGVLTVGCAVSIEEQVRYTARLVLDGRRIHAELNGMLCHDFTEPETVLEPLYCAASEEEDGRTYVKLVNVKAEPASVTVAVRGRGYRSEAEWELLSCEDLAAENTMERPNRLVPERRTVEVIQQEDAAAGLLPQGGADYGREASDRALARGGAGKPTESICTLVLPPYSVSVVTLSPSCR